ncbi:methyltransferase domain-containing protein [Endozoicomonas elysicola]|uniref:Methyltransferase type 11 domain-containing protein n=1 Tax=Endozoicomonas elysicola TaxID=305900 RepID=A0A081KC41_9GAMM|nr:methyltransferase domain-containing protein [Endozoicomonas elysicola]KEI71717.1 hypothetical protein GV64_14075 [Endozoicomonas elysicola]
MSSQYADAFEQRGHPYDQAMQRFPDSRNFEFIHLFDQIDLTKARRILDLPSGGGYLSQFLPEHCELDSADPSSQFRKSDAIYELNLESLVLPESHYDLVISLAALHHIENKPGFLNSVANTLKLGGFCCFSDVAADSGISHFLDKFAGKYNLTGHKGSYLQIDAPYPGYMSQKQLSLVEHALKPCPWVFKNKTEMVEFCRLLFGLKAVSNQQVLDALSFYVGYTDITNSQGEPGVSLKWELLYITFQKQS